MGVAAGFGLAGIAMLAGLVVYIWGQKHLTHVGNLLPEEQRNEFRDYTLVDVLF